MTTAPWGPRPTIKELCRGRFVDLPPAGEAPRHARILIMCDNIRVMREEIGKIPFFYPQTEAEVPDWVDKHDRTIGALTRVIKAVAQLPEGTLLPSPFA